MGRRLWPKSFLPSLDGRSTAARSWISKAWPGPCLPWSNGIRRFAVGIDMKIARDGTWFYGGTPIARPALVRLFSTILRKDPEGYVLVTPIGKVAITLEDAP